MKDKNGIFINELEKEFSGSGEMSNFKFKQIFPGNKCYLYEVDENGHKHWEVFMRRFSPICVDFTKKIYSLTEFKEIYPKSNNFGEWAWCYTDMDKAYFKYHEIEYE